RVRLDYHVFIQHRGAQIAGPVVEHFSTEKARAASVMHDRFLDVAYKLGRARLGELGEGQTGRFAGAGVDLREHRNESAVAVFWVRVTELERAPLRMSLGRPPACVGGKGEHVGPSDRLGRPAERL